MEKSKKKQDNTQFAVNCTAMFVIISIVNVIISFIAAKYICIYTGNTLVPYYVLLACIFIGLEILLYFFTVPLASLVESLDRKKKRALLPKETEANEGEAETMTDADAESIVSQSKVRMQQYCQLTTANSMPDVQRQHARKRMKSARRGRMP